MPYICMIRTDIEDGTLQVLDLSPNESQRNLILEPPGQTKYVNRSVNNTVALNGTATSAAYKGLAAYLIDHVIDSGGATITALAANESAVAILAVMDGGGALTLAIINATIQGTSAGVATTLNTGGSNGTVADVLKILAGGDYTVPSGSVVGGLVAGAALGAFSSGTFRHTYDAGALNISFGEGQLSQFTTATYQYLGVTGAAVVVYGDDGALFV